MRGSYDRRAPLASSQIITLERMLEESESRNEELQAELATAKAAHHWVVLERDALRKELAELREAMYVYLNLEDCVSLERLEALLQEKGE